MTGDCTDNGKDRGICMEQVCYEVGGRTILDKFDLHVTPGINHTILGVSGVGKTTILKLLLGLLQPQSGTITIDGVCLRRLKERELQETRKRLAIVFQGGALFDSMTIGENVGYRLLEEGRLPEKEIEAIVIRNLGFVGLEHTIDLYPAELSGGMKKRVAIARALAADPDYIFFDEPTTGLDPIGVQNVKQLMLRLQKERKTTLMVTHDLETAFAVSSRFSFIHEGRPLFEGNRQELLESSHLAIRRFLNPTDSSLFSSEMPSGQAASEDEKESRNQ